VDLGGDLEIGRFHFSYVRPRGGMVPEKTVGHNILKAMLLSSCMHSDDLHSSGKMNYEVTRPPSSKRRNWWQSSEEIQAQPLAEGKELA